jgi:hypothetical protein
MPESTGFPRYRWRAGIAPGVTCNGISTTKEGLGLRGMTLKKGDSHARESPLNNQEL